MVLEVQIKDDSSILLNPVRKSSSNKLENYFELVDRNNKKWMLIKQQKNSFEVIEKDKEIIDDDENLQAKLDNLFLEIIESEQSGTDGNGDFEVDISPFNPEDIKVHAKQFSLRLVSDMIEEGDINLSPDFQRNFVWNSVQKSRLIESILLRIPLPMFYFSEDNVGKITIVDGLQRLTTIKEFMDNKFPLRNLEYLEESCGGKYYFDSGKKIGLEPKYKRWFNQTQFSVNVIDPSSPSKVKYDIFRRINTGGKPLKNQEIRNCLASSELRNTLNEMVGLPEFKSATDNSIKSMRMEDQEVVLRFLYFYRLIESDKSIENYSGNMENSLDSLTEELASFTKDQFRKYVNLFSNSMQNAEYLFGRKFAFRKVRPDDIYPNSYKQLINKALFVCWSVLLCEYDPEVIKNKNKPGVLLNPLAEKIEEDIDLLNYLSYGTNGKNNLLYALKSSYDLIQNHLNF
jgi:uncharacterized protein with ParB-like and HNH nuclease domain